MKKKTNFICRTRALIGREARYKNFPPHAFRDTFSSAMWEIKFDNTSLDNKIEEPHNKRWFQV